MNKWSIHWRSWKRASLNKLPVLCHPDPSADGEGSLSSSEVFLKQVQGFFPNAQNDLKEPMRSYYVYILTNKSNTLYVGVSGPILQRLYQHQNKLIPGFTSKYNLDKLIFFEEFNNPEDAIRAEKKIKGWTRKKKMDLIKTINPDFHDLSLDNDANKLRDSSLTLRMTEGKI